MRSARLRLIAPVVGIAGFLLAWELLVRITDARPFVLRAPSKALAHLWKARAGIGEASWQTVQHAFVGLAIALVVAVVIGSAMAASSFFEQATQPVLILVQVTPFVAYITSVVLWLGFGTPPVLFITALVCTPAFAFAASDGMRSADPASRELLASVDASRWEVLWRLRLPSAAPSLFTAARYNVGLALIAAYLVEGGNLDNQGLGALGKQAISQGSRGGDLLWAIVMAMAIVGGVWLVLLSVLRRLVLHWHASERSQRSPRG